MKKILCVIILIFLFGFTASAEQNTYQEQYDAAGLGELGENISDTAKDFFDSLDIDPEDPDWVNRLSAGNVFSKMAEFLVDGGRGPLRAAAQMLGIIVLYSAAVLWERVAKYRQALSYVFMLITAANILLPLFSVISATADAIKGTATFMTAFVPIYSGLLTVGGKGLTASGMSFLLLFAAEGVNMIASFVIVPMMSCYLGMGLVSGVMPGGSALTLGESIKKATAWFFSLVITVFLGLLSVQTAVNASADSAGLRTVRFVLGSLVPVTGGALSESLNTLNSSMKLLQSSVGMYAVIALGVSVLPLVLELLLWRLSLFAVTAAAELFGIKEGVSLFRCTDYVLSTLLGIILFSASLFIISLAVVTNSL